MPTVFQLRLKILRRKLHLVTCVLSTKFRNTNSAPCPPPKYKPHEKCFIEAMSPEYKPIEEFFKGYESMGLYSEIYGILKNGEEAITIFESTREKIMQIGFSCKKLKIGNLSRVY